MKKKEKKVVEFSDADIQAEIQRIEAEIEEIRAEQNNAMFRNISAKNERAESISDVKRSINDSKNAWNRVNELSSRMQELEAKREKLLMMQRMREYSKEKAEEAKKAEPLVAAMKVVHDRHEAVAKLERQINYVKPDEKQVEKEDTRKSRKSVFARMFTKKKARTVAAPQKEEIKLGNTISESLGMKTISEMLFGKPAPVAEKPIAKPVRKPHALLAEKSVVAESVAPISEKKQAQIEQKESVIDVAKRRAEQAWSKVAVLTAALDVAEAKLKSTKGTTTRLSQNVRSAKSKKVIAEIRARKADDYLKRLLAEAESMKKASDNAVELKPVASTKKVKTKAVAAKPVAEKPAASESKTQNDEWMAFKEIRAAQEQDILADKVADESINMEPRIQFDPATGEEFVVLRGKWVEIYREHMRVVSMSSLINDNKPIVKVANGGNVYAESEQVSEPVEPVFAPVSINDKYIQEKRAAEANAMTINKKYAQQQAEQDKVVAEPEPVVVDEPAVEPIVELEPVVMPVLEPIAETPVVEEVEPVAEPEPVVEPVAEPVAAEVAEPIIEPVVKTPVAEAVAEPEPVATEPAEQKVVYDETNRDEYSTNVIKNMSDKMSGYHGVVADSEKRLSREEVAKKQDREEKTTKQIQDMDAVMNNSSWLSVLGKGRQ